MNARRRLVSRRLYAHVALTVSVWLLVAGTLAGCDGKKAPPAESESTTAAVETAAVEPAAPAVKMTLKPQAPAEARPKPSAAIATKPFIERLEPTDLRVVDFNVDSVYSDLPYLVGPKFYRVIKALDPDILTLQETAGAHDADYLTELLDAIIPLPDGAHWHVYRGSAAHMANVVASRYPLSMTGDATDPPAYPPKQGGRNARVAFALVDLPDDRFPVDLYVSTHHFKSGGGTENDPLRQQEADALVAWWSDARTPGGKVDVPANTAFIVTGDLNTVGGPQVLETVITGDIQDEQRFGADSAPDWDNTPITDAKPLHNAIGPDVYTWRNDSSEYAPGRLDYIIYTDSNIEVAHKFVLNTTTMSPELLQAAGLEKFDVAEDDEGVWFDHLPVVVDFRFVGASE
ncbi:MAG: endonuclease/exonuclease/phosphatase family protein [Phycisphaerae bacterium]|nr:endonuclease/exonuclease/phosphatase family protein [Phycisphaerae bacterium]